MNNYVTSIVYTITASSGITTEDILIFQSYDQADTAEDAGALAMEKFLAEMDKGYTIRAEAIIEFEVGT